MAETFERMGGSHGTWMHPPGRKSTVTDGARWFVVIPMGPHRVGMPHARDRCNVASLRLETQGWN